MISFDPMLAAIFSLTALLGGATLVLVPRFSAPAVRLGVRVPERQRNHTVVQRQEKIFQKRQIAVAVVAAVLAFAAATIPVVGALMTLIPVVFFIWNLNNASAPIRRVKQQEKWFDGVRTTVAGRLSKPNSAGGIDITAIEGYPHRAVAVTWACNLASFVLLLLAAAYVAIRWEDIPERFATHFGAGFEPDEWSDKIFSSVFFATIFGACMVALLGLMSAWMLRIDLPARADSSLRGKIMQQMTLRLTAAWLGVLNLTMAIMFAGLQTFTVLPDLMRWAPAVLMVSMIAIMCGALAMVVSLLLQRSSLTPAVDAYVESVASDMKPDTALAEGRDNDEHYKWGMFYYNPDDPAVTVEKRYGVGVDFNYAHWQAKVFMVVVGLLVIVPLALAFLL